jgi:hypothetical protein
MAREDLDSHVAAAAQADLLADVGATMSASVAQRRAKFGFSFLSRASALLPKFEIIVAQPAEIPPVRRLMTRMPLTPTGLGALAAHSVTVTRIVPLPNSESQQPKPPSEISKTTWSGSHSQPWSMLLKCRYEPYRARNALRRSVRHCPKWNVVRFGQTVCALARWSAPRWHPDRDDERVAGGRRRRTAGQRPGASRHPEGMRDISAVVHGAHRRFGPTPSRPLGHLRVWG